MNRSSVRWGILGTAAIADTMSAALSAADRSNVVAVASRDGQRARTWADERGIEHSFGSYQALLDSGAVDAVYIPLPNALHVEWTLECIERGLPVLCEKPLATTTADAARVAEASKLADVLVVEALMYRFHPQYSRLREILSSGTIGPLRSIVATFTFDLGDEESVVGSAELGGGSLLDVGSYVVDAARLVTGEEPVRVCALASYSAGVDRSLVGSLTFPGGVLASVETSICTAERHILEVSGTTGSVVLPSPWIPGASAASVITRRHEQADEVERVGPADSYGLQVDDFVGAMLDGRPPRWSISDAVALAKVLDDLRDAALAAR